MRDTQGRTTHSRGAWTLSDPQRVFVYRNTDPLAPKFAIRDLTSGDLSRSATRSGWPTPCSRSRRPDDSGRSSEQRRTVHAGVFGTLLDAPRAGRGATSPCATRPAESPYFLNDEHRPVHEALLVHLVAGKAYVPREARWL